MTNEKLLKSESDVSGQMLREILGIWFKLRNQINCKTNAVCHSSPILPPTAKM
jgi:hypothetical protein